MAPARNSSDHIVFPPEPTGIEPERLSEKEFQELAAGLVEDSVAEWLWRMGSPGPLAAVPFDETAG